MIELCLSLFLQSAKETMLYKCVDHTWEMTVVALSLTAEQIDTELRCVHRVYMNLECSPGNGDQVNPSPYSRSLEH